LSRHIRSVHESGSRVKVRCPVEGCPNTTRFCLDRMDNLRQHLTLKHGYRKEYASDTVKCVVDEARRKQGTPYPALLTASAFGFSS